MNKRLVVLLDEGAAAATALRMGLRRAKLYDGVLAGVAVVDVEAIEREIGGAPAGAIHFAEQARESLIAGAQQKVEALRDAFLEACRGENVRHEVYIKSGPLARELAEETRTADLLLVGIRSGPDHAAEREELLRSLVEPAWCPVIAVPPGDELPGRVVVAYDGSLQAARALKAFAQASGRLPFAREAVLLNVNDDSEAGQDLLAKAEAYLVLHGFGVCRTVRAGPVHDVIHRVAREKPATGVVIGAYGHGGLSRLLFGSSARTLVRDGSIPLFIYH